MNICQPQVFIYICVIKAGELCTQKGSVNIMSSSIRINITTEGEIGSRYCFHRKQTIYKFNNGFSCSVVWGTNLYCSDRYERYDINGIRGVDFNEVEEAEVAVLNKDENIIYNINHPCLNNCDVFGWCDADRVAEILYQVSRLPEDFEGYTLSPFKEDEDWESENGDEGDEN